MVHGGLVSTLLPALHETDFYDMKTVSLKNPQPFPLLKGWPSRK